MRQTFLWRLLRRSEALKSSRRWILRTGRKLGRYLSRDGKALGQGSVLYLTFDDGPDPVYSPQILDLLARYDAKAVFFVIGSQVVEGKSIIERELAEGHRLGNHTWSHIPLAGLSRTEFDSEIVRTQEVLVASVNQRPRTMRPPFGSMDSRTAEWARDAGVDILLWDIDPQDWDRPGSDAIVKDIIDSARDGDIILLHDGGGDREQTVAALEVLLSTLSEKGVRFPVIADA